MRWTKNKKNKDNIHFWCNSVPIRCNFPMTLTCFSCVGLPGADHWIYCERLCRVDILSILHTIADKSLVLSPGIFPYIKLSKLDLSECKTEFCAVCAGVVFCVCWVLVGCSSIFGMPIIDWCNKIANPVVITVVITKGLRMWKMTS